MHRTILIIATLIALSTCQEPCSLCKGGASYDSKFSEEQISISIGNFTIELTCSALNASLPFLISNDTTNECRFIRSLGSMCGCPTPDDACYLCPDKTQCTSRDLPLPFFKGQFGFIPTCGILETFLLSEAKSENSSCLASQTLLADYCGCNGAKVERGCSFCPDGQQVGFPNKALSIAAIPLKTCAELDFALSMTIEKDGKICTQFQKFGSYCGCSVQENACEMCPHGNLAYPDKEVKILLGGTLSGSIEPTCKIVEGFTRSTIKGSDECLLFQMIGGFCGCPPVEDSCKWCRNSPIPESYYDRQIPPKVLEKVTGFRPKNTFLCEDAQNFLTQIATNHEVCRLAQHRGDICGCYEGGFGYFGTEGNPERRVILSAIARVSAILSLISVSFITFDVLRNSKRRGNVYCRLMLGMSFCDFFYSLAWMAFSAPIPNDPAASVYGASGTSETCQVQCFFFQFGLASIFYNASLATYYFLIIGLSKRENWLQRQQWWLHGIPFVSGISLSGASIPFASNNYYGCHLPITPTLGTTALFLFVLPIIVVVLYCTFLILFIVHKVHQQNKKARRWRHESREQTSRDRSNMHGSTDQAQHNRGGNKGSGILEVLERQVILQAILYLAALWCTWPLFIVPYAGFKYIQDLNESEEYAFYFIIFLLAPLQGFLNGLIYFRKRILSFLCKSSPPASINSNSSGVVSCQRRKSQQAPSVAFLMQQVDADEIPRLPLENDPLEDESILYQNNVVKNSYDAQREIELNIRCA